MNLMWFENFWVVDGIVLFFVLGLPLFLFLVSTFSFAVAVLSISVSISPFLGLTFVIFAKGSKAGALRPFSNWDFEPYSSALWRNPLEFEFLLAGSNWEFELPCWSEVCWKPCGFNDGPQVLVDNSYPPNESNLKF